MSDEKGPKSSAKIVTCNCSYHPQHIHCWAVCNDHSSNYNPNSTCGRRPSQWIEIRNGYANGQIVDEKYMVCHVCLANFSASPKKGMDINT